MNETRPTPKSEAKRALAHVLEILARPILLDDLGRRQLAATLVYAVEQIDAIQELKRARPAPKRRQPETGDPEETP